MGMRGLMLAAVAALALAGPAGAKASTDPTVTPPGIMAASAQMAAGQTTSEALVKLYLARIAVLDSRLHAIIALNPHALADARRLDAERRAGHVRGPLHGVPILIKDNIESDDGTATTAGSLALMANITRRDAPMVARLKAAGAVILGKTNLSEWANIRSTHSLSGWSAVGGMVHNPFALNRTACGSSAGSGAAAAAGLAAAAVGTETDGSVTCPSSINGLVGLKPTLGLISRTRIVPISHSQDTPGPMARSVEDAAALLTALAGTDPADPATAEADAHKTDYTRALTPDALRGKRIGVLRPDYASSAAIATLYAAALDKLRAAGAVLVEVKMERNAKIGQQEFLVLGTELKADMNAYLATTPPTVKARTMAELIAFNKATPRELVLFGQETFELAEGTKGLDDPAYKTARAESQGAARAALDKPLTDERLDALVSPTLGPAWPIDVIGGDRGYGGSAASLPAVSGYPHLTVPMGLSRGLPVGLSFIGPPWSDGRLLGFGYAFQEQGVRFTPPAFPPSAEDGAAFEPLR